MSTFSFSELWILTSFETTQRMFIQEKWLNLKISNLCGVLTCLSPYSLLFGHPRNQQLLTIAVKISKEPLDGQKRFGLALQMPISRLSLFDLPDSSPKSPISQALTYLIWCRLYSVWTAQSLEHLSKTNGDKLNTAADSLWWAGNRECGAWSKIPTGADKTLTKKFKNTGE